MNEIVEVTHLNERLKDKGIKKRWDEGMKK